MGWMERGDRKVSGSDSNNQPVETKKFLANRLYCLRDRSRGNGTETERGPLTSQRGRLVLHLDAVSSTVRAERSSRGSPRQAGRWSLTDWLTALFSSYRTLSFTATFFFSLLIPPVILFWAETPRPTSPSSASSSPTDLMRVFLRGRGSSALKT